LGRLCHSPAGSEVNFFCVRVLDNGWNHNPLN
jgi:hypothetical protein